MLHVDKLSLNEKIYLIAVSKEPCQFENESFDSGAKSVLNRTRFER